MKDSPDKHQDQYVVCADYPTGVREEANNARVITENRFLMADIGDEKVGEEVVLRQAFGTPVERARVSEGSARATGDGRARAVRNLV